MPNRKTYPHQIIGRLEPLASLTPEKLGSPNALATAIQQPSRTALRGLLSTVSALLLAACGPNEVTIHSADDYPDRLSDWGLVSLDGGQLIISDQ